MKIMETEEKLFKILAEYGRIHEDDMEILYSSRKYMQERLNQMIEEKYLKEINAIVKEDGDKKTVKARDMKLIQLTSKGKKEVADIGVIIRKPITTTIGAMEKQRKQTKTAVILDKMGIPVLETEYSKGNMEKWFEQSSVVKKNCDTLNNHSRMMGILYSPGGDYAVYNIGDGTGKWYISEERTILNVRQYDRQISEMVIFVKDKNAQENFEAIISKSKDNSFLIGTELKTCSILTDDADGYEMLMNMTNKDWKKRIAEYCLNDGAVEEPTIKFADYKYKDKHVVIMVHNCMVRRKSIQSYQSVMQYTRNEGKDVLIICLDNQYLYYRKMLPNVEKKTISQEKVNEICNA